MRNFTQKSEYKDKSKLYRYFVSVRKFSLLLCLSFFALQIQATVLLNVKGKITDENGAGLPGVSIAEKGTNNGTNTTGDGTFTLNVRDANSTLVISAIGYSTQEVKVGNQTVINLQLKPSASSLDEVVVVGYGTQKKATVTGAVVQITGEKVLKSPATDMGSSLSGRLPGLVVIQTSGEPGNDAALLRIRGQNTLGNSSPLVVIDGIPDREGGLSRLSPRDVESISVLKDASAAIYGARAANGAIIITTKRGKSGKPTVTYDFNQGITQPGTVPQMSSAAEYANIMNEINIYKNIPVGEWGAALSGLKSTGSYTSPTKGAITANYSPGDVKKWTDNSDPLAYPSTDWFGATFKTWAPQSRHNLQISGGTDALRYMASGGYVHQDAIYKNSATYYNQYSFRTNVDAKINNYIKTSLGIMVRREDKNLATEGAGSIFRMLMRGRPGEQAVWPDGRPGPDIENGQNPVAITTNLTGYQREPTDYVQSNGLVEITNPWAKGLKLTLSGSLDKSSSSTKRWETPWSLYNWDKKTFEADGKTPKLVGAIRSNIKSAQLSQGYGSNLNYNLTGMLNYDLNLDGGHAINTMVGVTKEKFEGDFFFAFRRNFISSALDQLFAGGALQQNNGGSGFNRARLGYYGRVQYGFKEKYLAEFIFRNDGSYIFPEAKRFGFFPGVLLGWNVTAEPWFKVPAIDYLKLRGSYGEMGNDQVFYNGRLQEYAFLSTYSFGQYPINSSVSSTLYETSLANPDFTWERARNKNIGLDATLFHGKIDMTLEYFQNNRDQILIQKTGSTPASSGITSLLPPVNAGKVQNAGYEFTINYNGKAKRDLTFRAGVNGGYAKNKVIFMDEVPGAPAYQRMEGKPISAILAFEADGVFKDAASIDANKLDYSGVTGKLLPGDMKFKDINGDGKINADDATRLEKNDTPNFQFGVTGDVRYKNFDLNILFQGATGALLRVQTESGDIGNFLKYSHDNRWSIDKPSDTHPRLASRGDTYYTGGPYGSNTYFLFSKNYLRLKNVEIGYTLPASIMEKIKIGSIRFFANGLNLFTISKMKVFDPETTNGGGTVYPQSRVINGGFSITF